MYTHIAHLDQQALSPDPIIGLLKVYEHSQTVFLVLDALAAVSQHESYQVY